VDVGGTIFPGPIELHNHLAYNALALWQVPRPFTNRGQWGLIDAFAQMEQQRAHTSGRIGGQTIKAFRSPKIRKSSASNPAEWMPASADVMAHSPLASRICCSTARRRG
jgi:hypothetical protein